MGFALVGFAFVGFAFVGFEVVDRGVVGGEVDVGEEADEGVVATLLGVAAQQVGASVVAVLLTAGGPVAFELGLFELVEEGGELRAVDVGAGDDEAELVVAEGE
ncbi:unannotated protein [freshwater metagenome]|uniref:Unannotated protein n=1 Tax=freshwater metagenome TaxID=449393 RepID=A0A6J6EZR2_9ZZZZ